MPTSLRLKQLSKAQEGILSNFQRPSVAQRDARAGRGEFDPALGPLTGSLDDPNVATGEDDLRALASSLGIDFDALNSLFSLVQPEGADTAFGPQLAFDALLQKLLDPSGSSAAGGVDSALGFSQLSESIRQFDQTFDFSRQSAMADVFADLIATEMARKGKQAELGGDLLEMFMGAIGTAVPKGLNTIPGFEPDGIAAKLGRSTGTDISATLAAAQNAEKTTIPFTQQQRAIDDIPGVQDLEPQLKSLVAGLFPQIQRSAGIAGSAGGVGGSTTPGASAPVASSAVSPGVASVVQDYLNSGVTATSSKSATPTPAPVPQDVANFQSMWNLAKSLISSGDNLNQSGLPTQISKAGVNELIQLRSFLKSQYISPTGRRLTGSEKSTLTSANAILDRVQLQIDKLTPKSTSSQESITNRFPGLR